MKTRLLSRFSSIEPLEPRVAPAVVILNPHTATYTDIDGDKVIITVSKGTLTAANILTAPKLKGDQLQMIDFSGGGFDDANLTVRVRRVAGGDGLAHVGYINSTGHDLGLVKVRGDLGQIDAGDANTADGAIKSLSVQSMGRFGLDTQAGIGSLQSDINGALGKLSVRGDVVGVSIIVGGGIGSITIGGSFIGGTNTLSGSISVEDDIGPVKITGNLLGGSGLASGRIAGGNLASVSIGGSIIGGSGDGSGYISLGGNIGPVKIGHDLKGGDGTNSGQFLIGGQLASLSIGGSLIGGSGDGSSKVESFGDMGPVKITHNLKGGAGSSSGVIGTGGTLSSVSIGGSLIGGSGSTSGHVLSFGDMGVVKIGGDLKGGSISGRVFSLDSSGGITTNGRIAGVSIGGSIISGIDSLGSLSSLTNNASIRADVDIGFVVVKGSIVGNSVGDYSPVIISARGQAAPGADSDTAIGRITVGGRVKFAQILAGYDIGPTPVNGNASIGPVKVGGDWIASDLIAGVTAGADGKFGTGDDASIGGGLVSRIASIVIGGKVKGSPSNISTADHFGFVAEVIGSFKVGLFKAALSPASGNDVIELSPTTNDVTLREV